MEKEIEKKARLICGMSRPFLIFISAFPTQGSGARPQPPPQTLATGQLHRRQPRPAHPQPPGLHQLRQQPRHHPGHSRQGSYSHFTN